MTTLSHAQDCPRRLTDSIRCDCGADSPPASKPVSFLRPATRTEKEVRTELHLRGLLTVISAAERRMIASKGLSPILYANVVVEEMGKIVKAKQSIEP
jgi:hypothetical protein